MVAAMQGDLRHFSELMDLGDAVPVFVPQRLALRAGFDCHGFTPETAHMTLHLLSVPDVTPPLPDVTVGGGVESIRGPPVAGFVAVAN